MAPADERATVIFTVENDGYFGEDDNYTSGLRLSYLSKTRELDAASRFFAHKVLGFGTNNPRLRSRRGFALGQEIYTPQDLRASGFLPDQHPYAGYLYGEYTSLIEQPNQVDRVGIQLGVVGPEALGEEAQDLVHDFTGRERALGWSNQLPTALGLNVQYERQRRLALGSVGPLGWDFVPNLGFSAGTVKTAARTGAFFRMGENLTTGYGPPRVRPNLAGSGFFTPQSVRSWYLFAGANAEAIAHTIFLDGSLFERSDPPVRSKPVVADFQGGAAVQLGPAQLSFTYVYRTREFDEQDEPQQFGALSLAAKF